MSAHEPMLLDDETILAWIEGELAPERHRLVTREISKQPALRARADAMRLDRLTLRALGDERAPAGLLDGVADLLERDMLVTIGEGLDERREPMSEEDRHATDLGYLVGHSIGHSAGLEAGGAIVHDPATGLRRVQRQRRFSPVRYALAAGLLIAVGGGAWFGGMMFAQRERVTPTSIASITRADNTDPASEVEPTGSAPPEATLTMGSESSPTLDASAGVARHQAGDSMTMERARALLLERRLIVRARMADLSGLAWIDGVAGRVALERDVQAELVLAVAPRDGAAVPEAREVSLLLAGDARVGPPIELATRDLPMLPQRELASIVVVELDARGLEEAIRGLRSQRGIVSVELEESGGPLPGLGRDTTGEHAEDERVMFWWREASERWAPSARAPIVFEVLR